MEIESTRRVQKPPRRARLRRFASLTATGVLLATALLARPVSAADGNPGAVDGAGSSAVGNAIAADAGTRASPTRLADGPAAEALATLGLLALGIGGLVWVRRHVDGL